MSSSFKVDFLVGDDNWELSQEPLSPTNVFSTKKYKKSFHVKK